MSKIEKKKFKVAVSWEVFDELEVEAYNLDEAIDLVYNYIDYSENDSDNPIVEKIKSSGNYVDASFLVDTYLTQVLNNDGDLLNE